MPLVRLRLLRAAVLGIVAPFAGLAGGAHAQAVPVTAAPEPVVTPTTGVVVIESDRQIGDNSTGIVTALGNVRIVYPDQRVVATARQAQYFSREGRVVLSGDVDVVQTDGPSIQAERITYLVELERVIADPAAGSQVFTTIPLAAFEDDPAAAVRPLQ